MWLNTDLIGGAAIIAFFLGLVISGIRLQVFANPRCHRCFSGDWCYNKSFLAGKCVHCGLPKFSEDGN